MELFFFPFLSSTSFMYVYLSYLFNWLLYFALISVYSRALLLLYPPNSSEFSSYVFLNMYTIYISSLSCQTLCIVINIFVIWFICLTSSLVNFRNGPKYPTKGTDQVLFLWENFLYRAWFWKVLFSWLFSLFRYVFFHFFCLVSASIISNCYVLTCWPSQKCHSR